MDETMEKEKPKFVCKLCKLDYPSSVQFEEHLWSMLHHKALNNKALRTKHHCNLCMFESFNLNAYGKHLISDQHKRSLVERRKRLGDPRQVKPTAPASAASCSERSESPTITSTQWETPRPANASPSQGRFQHVEYPQSHQDSNRDYHYGGQSRHHQGDWQQTRNPFYWRPPYPRFEQPSWENNSRAFDPRQRFGTSAHAVRPYHQRFEQPSASWDNSHAFKSRQRFPTQAVKQRSEKIFKKTVKLRVQKNGGKRKEEENKANVKRDNVTTTVNFVKATQHSVASQELFAHSSHSEKPSDQHEPSKQAHPDLVKKDMRSESEPNIKIAGGPTPKKKKKKKKKVSPKIRNKQGQTGNTPNTPKPFKGKFKKKKKSTASLQNNPSATSYQPPMQRTVKESKSLGNPTESDKILPKATSAIDRFEIHLREALHAKDNAPDIVEVTSSNGASVSKKAADRSAFLLKPTHPTVSSSSALPNRKTRFEEVSCQPHSHCTQAADKETSKMSSQMGRPTSSDEARVSETASTTLPTSTLQTELSAAPVSSFYSLQEGNGKWSTEIRCPPSLDKLTSEIQNCKESSTTGTSANGQDIRLSSSTARTDNSISDESSKLTSKSHRRVESSIRGTDVRDIRPSTSSTANNNSEHKEMVTTEGGETVTGESSKGASKTLCHMESLTPNRYDQDIRPSSSSGTKDSSLKHKEPVQSKVGEIVADKSSLDVPSFARSSCLNPRPNLTNARSRLRTNKDAEQPDAGHIFKEKIQGLLSDVAKPVWQQKKLRMMLAKAKKAPGRFNRFSHLASSPSRSEDTIDSVDIMNLSTEFQQELLDLIQSEDADEEDILSQLTAPEFLETSEPNQDVFIRGNTLHFGDIQEAPPLMSQDRLHPSHAVTSASPVDPEAVYPSHSVTTPVVKLEPPDTSESMAFQPSLEWERLLHKEQSHPGQTNSSSIEVLDAPHERGSSERQSFVASATYGIREELLTIADLDQRTLQPSRSLEGQSQQGIGSRKPDENPDAREPSERHDTSVTSTSSIPSPAVGSTVKIKKAHKKKKKKDKKTKAKERNPSPVEEVRNKLPLKKKPKSKTSKSANVKRTPVKPVILGRVKKRTKSPTVLKATKIKKKFMQKRKMLDTMVGDMGSLLDITLQENKLQTKMDKLNAKIDKLVEIIQEKEAMLKSFKQEKETVIGSLTGLREKRLNLLLGLTSSGKAKKSVSSMDKRDGSRTDEGRSSSSNQSQLSSGRGPSLQAAPQQAGMGDVVSEAVQSGAEGDIRISNVMSMAQTTPSHRTEGFRITFGSPARTVSDQGQGTMDTFGDVGRNQDVVGINVGSPPPQSCVGQSIEVLPQVMSRESFAKTLQELNSCGAGVKVDIFSDDETLYGIDCERLMHRESVPASGDVIGAVAKLVNANVMSTDRDRVTESMGLSTVSDVTAEPFQIAVHSDQVRVRRERTDEPRSQGTLPLQSDTDEDATIMGSSCRNVTSSETSFRRIKQEPQDIDDISQRQEAIMSRDNERCTSGEHGEPFATKRKRWKPLPEDTRAKRPKHSPKDTVLRKKGQEPEALHERISSAHSPEPDKTLISQTEKGHKDQSKVTRASNSSGSKDSIPDNPCETSVSLKKGSESNTAQQSAQDSEDANRQEKATSSLRSKGYVINMYIIEDKLYACISDSRFIIFNLATNKIDAEEDLALGNIKHFELWRDTTANKMVAFASDGSRNLVQFDVKAKEFLQTLVLGKEITCLHVKWNSLYAGLADGEIANINVQKSKVSWYYSCTPSFAVTAMSSTLEGGMGLLITASEDRTVTLRRASDGLLLRSLDGHSDVVTHLQVQGCRVLAMARNNTVLIHDLETGETIRRVKHQTKMACCVMSGDTLAVAGYTGNVYYYKIKLFLGIRDGFIDVIPLYPSIVYQCEWSHCISRFLRLDALKTHLQHIHIRRSARQCLWKTCLKNYPQKNTTLKAIEKHVFSHLKVAYL
ncbi:uncharacterized protein LOC763525 isoform X2 [Strongylocentrotus purpuratus]|uniref:C2H2-type domain-containing protein n=1 Tax=Strongylocentrotus purpuratus TaxID=7668 RepID=A0A7M7PSH0_STRPU|nr:uncharacterized protein LOC763525 isoform X2 [Strongylocentrotus purpuratus]